MPPAAADTITFDPPYVTGTALDGQDGWRYWKLVQLCSKYHFQPQMIDGEQMLRCETSGLTEYHRPLASRSEATDLTWRWRANTTDARLIFGPSSMPYKTNNNYVVYRARVDMSSGEWGVRGASWAVIEGDNTWEANTWYYMRMRLDPAAARFSVWIATLADRTDERVLVADAVLAGTGPVDRVLLKADQCAGIADIDDIFWGPPPGPDRDSDEDGVPDAIESALGTGTDDALSFPCLAKPSRWSLPKSGPVTVSYDFSSFPNFSTRKAVAMTFAEGDLDDSLVPAITMYSLRDQAAPAFTAPSAGGVISGVFDVRSNVASGRAVRMGFPLPDNTPSRAGHALEVYHHHASAWEKVNDVEVLDGLVYASFTGFSEVLVFDPTVVYVDAAATLGAGDGTSWSDAFTTLQAALSATAASATIWLAQGTYRPAKRFDPIVLEPGVTILGGFAAGMTEANARRPDVHQSILSGDLADNDRWDANSGNLESSDNAATVLLADRETAMPTRIDGITITGGCAVDTVGFSGAALGSGGGLVVAPGAHGYEFVNCTFRRNSAPLAGGGAWVDNGSGIVFDGCLFEENMAGGDGGLGISYGEVSVSGSRFVRNRARTGSGGALGVSRTNITVSSCSFVGNGAPMAGGAIEVHAASPVFVNCMFLDNWTEGRGGALSVSENRAYGYPGVEVNFCTFMTNSGWRSGGSVCASGADLLLRNTILWGGSSGGAREIVVEDAQLQLSHVCLTGGIAGIERAATATVAESDVIDNDPLFVDENTPLGPDGICGTRDDGLRPMRPGSPCVDAGVEVPGVGKDIADRTRERGAGVDLGAHESALAIVYVNHANASPGDGTSWTAALTDLQAALDTAEKEASDADADVMVWVAGVGPYRPGRSVPVGGGAQTGLFRIGRGMHLAGGFAGNEKSITELRPFSRPLSCLEPWPSDTGSDGPLILSTGFTLTGFDLNGLDATSVALTAMGGATELRRCRILRFGSAQGRSREGCVRAESGRTRLTQTLIADNAFVHTLVYVQGNARLELDGCAIDRNTCQAPSTLGGIVGRGVPEVDKDGLLPPNVTCRPSVRIANTAISDNELPSPLLSLVGCDVEVVNSTVVRNLSSVTPGRPLLMFGSSRSIIVNTILEEPLPKAYADMYRNWPRGNASYRSCWVSDSSGIDDGYTVFCTDLVVPTTGKPSPGFVDPGRPMGSDGLWGTLDDGLRLSAGSPCVDAGSTGAAPPSDLVTIYRPLGGGVDIGAYEYLQTDGRIRLGRYTADGFELIDQPSAITNIVDEYHVNRAVVAGQAAVVQVDIPDNDYTRGIDRVEALVFCVDAAGNNVSGVQMPVTLYRVPGTDQARTKVLAGRKVLGKSIVVATTPEVANREFRYAYVLFGASGCLIKVVVKHDQFQ